MEIDEVFQIQVIRGIPDSSSEFPLCTQFFSELYQFSLNFMTSYHLHYLKCDKLSYFETMDSYLDFQLVLLLLVVVCCGNGTILVS